MSYIATSHGMVCFRCHVIDGLFQYICNGFLSKRHISREKCYNRGREPLRANLCAHGTFVASTLQFMITWQHSGCKQKLYIITMCSFMSTFQVYAKPIFADKVALHNSKAYAHHSATFFTPLSSFSM